MYRTSPSGTADRLRNLSRRVDTSTMGRLVRHGRRRSLDKEIGGAFRSMLVGVTVILVVSAVGFGWLVGVNTPRLDRLDTAVAAVRDAHVALINQETAVRGYLVTGDTAYLGPYDSGQIAASKANGQLNESLLNPALAERVLDFRLTQERWSEGWAALGANSELRNALINRTTAQLDPQKLNTFFTDGKVLFDQYRDAQGALLAEVREQRNAAKDQQELVMSALLGFILLVCVVLGCFAGARRRRLGREVIAPIDSLVATIHDVARGRLVPPPAMDSSTEVVDLRDGLTAMIAALTEERDLAAARAEQTAATDARLRAVLRFAREVSGSLSSRYVLDAVTTAACSITEGERSRIWMVDDAAAVLHLAFDSKVGRKGNVEESDTAMGSGAVGRAAKYGQVSYSGDLEGDTVADGDGNPVVAFPLIVGARVVGVLEIEIAEGERFDDELLELIETLAGHSAAALEAARLYQDSEELSSSDALTGLANRRRLDADLATEVELAIRHGRPLGFVMLDLDHFKKVNDTYGHQQGDQILQDVAAILRAEARPGDGVYRYGGEELAIVVRESDAEGAHQFAERIRAAVEKRFTRAGTVTQTLSAGVAAVPFNAATPAALVAAADAALYTAKQRGRNRVEVAGSGDSPLLDAPTTVTPAVRSVR